MKRVTQMITKQGGAVCMLLLMALCAPLLEAQSPDQLFTTANNAYKEKNYEVAIEAYQKLDKQGYHQAAIYYNLGDAYYKTNQIGQAILYFEKAQKLAPADEDIRYNLKLANLKVVDKITPVPQLAIVTGWEHFTHTYSSTGWSYFSVAAVWLALICFTLYLFVDSFRRIGFFTGSFMLLLAFFFFYLSYGQSKAEYDSDQAILTTANAYVKSAPDAGGTDLFIIHEGIKLSVLDKVGEWAKVRLADGKVGWIQHTTYTLI
jgi:tetratricopeptide (TPR) repeat protein